MNLPDSAKEQLAIVFYNNYKTPSTIDDAMSILKIMDFGWDSDNGVLFDENTNRPIPREVLKSDSQWKVVPVKNISNFDLNCLERVLNTRSMKGVISPPYLGPLFECLGWKIELSGDTYRLHFVGGTDYWESKDPKQWDSNWTEGWKEPWVITKDKYLRKQEEIDKSIDNSLNYSDEYLNEEDTDENEESFDWDPNGEIPKEWI